MRKSLFIFTAIAVLCAGAVTAQLSDYMGGGIGNNAPPSDASVSPYFLDQTDRLCVADYGNFAVRCIVGGRVVSVVTLPQRPIGVARAADGRIYVSTQKVIGSAPSPAQLLYVEADGTLHQLAIPAGAEPYGLRLAAGFLWVADVGIDRVYRYALPVTTASAAQFVTAVGDLRDPQALDWAPGRGLVIADTTNAVIRLLSPGGAMTVVAGTVNLRGYQDGPAASSLFAFPTNVLVAPDGRIFIADNDNNRVRQLSADMTTVTTVAGNGLTNLASSLRCQGRTR